MPNYVTNKLTLHGDLADLADFIERNRSDNEEGWPLDFGQLVPMPQEVRDAPSEPNSTPLWYGWCIENWGTKWNADSVEIEGKADDGEVTYSFLTAWSPPDAWLAVATSAYSDLRFHHEFVEEMLHFAGKADWVAGEIVKFEPVEAEELEWVEVEVVEWDE